MDNFTVALAPLAGVTDSAFRKICKSFGADLMTTEMISAKGLYYKDKKTAELMHFDELERPVGIQIFGSEPAIMAYAAEKVSELSPSFIDINMGCPMPKIVNNGDGSALLKNLPLAARVIESTVKAATVPVSVKFRIGYDEEHIVAVDFAKMCEESGASFITVHGRTTAQLYSGKADWEIIGAVKNAVRIPVFGNGDIFTADAAKKMREETRVDGVAIARGALGNPFIFEQVKDYMQFGTYKTYAARERLSVALKQVSMMCEEKPERLAIPQARKHIAWYLKGMPDSNTCKTRVFSAKTLAEIEDTVNSYLAL